MLAIATTESDVPKLCRVLYTFPNLAGHKLNFISIQTAVCVKSMPVRIELLLTRREHSIILPIYCLFFFLLIFTKLVNTVNGLER